MPSIGAVTAIIIGQRIDEAMKATFDEETRKDAEKVLALSSKGGETIGLWITGGAGALYVFLLVLASHPIYALLCGICAASIMWLLARRVDNARKELNELIASNPGYWKPIAEKVYKVVLEAGKFDDGFGVRQRTKIVH